MIRCIISDLSEVLIAGLLGLEDELAHDMSCTPAEVLLHLGGEPFMDLLCGRVSQDAYLAEVISRAGWQITPDRLKDAIRANLRREVPGSAALMRRLAARYRLVLLSDHAREWAGYILSTHPFIRMFERLFFSFELGSTKRDPDTFVRVLQTLDLRPDECLLIDDSQRNLAVAASVGIQGIRFASAEQLEADLVALGLL